MSNYDRETTFNCSHLYDTDSIPLQYYIVEAQLFVCFVVVVVVVRNIEHRIVSG